jgi:hypothetical protein
MEGKGRMDGAQEPYRAPELTVYGTLADVTQIKPVTGEDLAHGSALL